MFNLIVGSRGGVIAKERFLESTSQEVRSTLSEDLYCELMKLPALVMPEVGDSTAEQIAHVGHITSLNEVDASVEFKFEEDTDVPPIGTGVIEQLSSELDASLDQWGGIGHAGRSRMSIVCGASQERVFSSHNEWL